MREFTALQWLSHNPMPCPFADGHRLQASEREAKNQLNHRSRTSCGLYKPKPVEQPR